MTVNFKYVPTAPSAISGPEVLAQTEQAFNELGALIDNSSAIAEEALQAAQGANQSANNALETAAEAESKAQQAVNSVTQLGVRVNTVETTADNAMTRANSAYDLAAQAKGKADTNTAEIATVRVTAKAADAKASAAQTAAQNAQICVNMALEQISAASDDYVATNSAITAVDLNTYYDSPVKLYLTGTEIINGPEHIDYPAFFSAETTDDDSRAIQIITQADTGARFIRTATVMADSEDEHEAAVWTEWTQQASGKKTVIVHSFAGERQDTLTAGSIYAVPEYTVGSNKLEIYLNGVRCVAGANAATASFAETGETGSSSNYITWHQDIDTSYNITVIAHQSGHGGSSEGEPSVAPQPAFQLLEFYSFRNPALQPGFYPRYGGIIENAATLHPEAWAKLQTEEGRQLCVTEAEWQAMSTAVWHTLADGTEIGWNGIGGVPFYAPNFETGALRLPDTRGMYSEDAGFDGLDVGGAHGDAVRNITGKISGPPMSNSVDPTSALFPSNVGLTGPAIGPQSYVLNMDISRVVPTAAKNQPRAFGVLPCVYLGTPK